MLLLQVRPDVLRSPLSKTILSSLRRSMTSKSPFPSYLIRPSVLANALRDPPSDTRIIPLAAPWFLPNDAQQRTGRQVFEQSRIPGARFIDVDGVKDAASPYPHMLPSAQTFADSMSELGIQKDDVVVVYDSKELGIFSAPRVAWMLKVFGHDRTHVLDNYKLWVEEGLPVEEGKPQEGWEKTQYPLPSDKDVKSRVKDFEEVKDLAKNHVIGKKVQLLDARSKGRWEGKEDEPRKGELRLSVLMG